MTTPKKGTPLLLALDTNLIGIKFDGGVSGSSSWFTPPPKMPSVRTSPLRGNHPDARKNNLIEINNSKMMDNLSSVSATAMRQTRSSAGETVEGEWGISMRLVGSLNAMRISSSLHIDFIITDGAAKPRWRRSPQSQ